MGRKIPARKHMGIKDPLQQQQKKFELIKDQIDNPPEKKDFQKVSHSLARFIKLKNEAAAAGSNESKKRKRIDNEDMPEKYKKQKSGKKSNEQTNEKQSDSIKKHSGESDKAFKRRMYRITQESMQEAKFQAKYGVEVIRNIKTGEIKLKKRPKDELDVAFVGRSGSQKGGNKKSVTPIKLSAEEKKKLIKEVMAQKHATKVDKQQKEVEFKQDEIKFGEIVHEPPRLVTPRLGQKAATVPRPGKKPLLLHSIVNGTAAKNTNEISHDLKGKRKDLSMAMRHMIDNEQKNVVQIYKDMKKQNRMKNK